MNDSLRRELIASLPPNIRIDSSVDYPDISTVKIRGVTANCAFTITWEYDVQEEFVQLDCLMLDQQSTSNVVPLKNLSQYLS
jgi:hypothetical protein